MRTKILHADELFRVAQKKHNAGRLDAAYLDYLKILRNYGDHADTFHYLGILFLQMDKVEQSVNWFQQSLRVNREQAEVWSNLGFCYNKLGFSERAIDACDHALKIDPDFDGAWTNRGNALKSSGQFNLARQSYEQALLLNPKEPMNHFNLAAIMFDEGQISEAQVHLQQCLRHGFEITEVHTLLSKCFVLLSNPTLGLEHADKALAENRSKAESWISRASALSSLKRFEEALEAFNVGLSLEPTNLEGLDGRAAVLQQLELNEMACVDYTRIVNLRPNSPKAWNNLGNILGCLSRHSEAIESFQRATELDPTYSEAYYNYGKLLQEQTRLKDALSMYDRATQIDPAFSKAWNNRGVVLSKLCRYDDAILSYDKALELNPSFREAWNNRGLALNETKNDLAAIKSFDQAISIDPNFALAYFCKSLALLRNGNFHEGWRLYEWRWRVDGLGLKTESANVPLWLGDENLSGKSIILEAEQGFGDTLQFCRYASLVAKLGAIVLMKVPQSLVTLIESVHGVSKVFSTESNIPQVDFRCPLMSLPLALRTELSNIPARVPYLSASVGVLSKWEKKLGNKKKPRIGFCHAGNPNHKNDLNRSIEFSTFSRLFALRYDWLSLQLDNKNNSSIESEELKFAKLSADLCDFSETAAVISHMDLVISVDTSVAHLAGALNKKVWLLLPFSPDFRWMCDTSQSSWYPSMRIFRQSRPNDWDAVISEIKEQLIAEFKV